MEADCVVRTIAKRLVFRLAATAKANYGASGKSESVALRIDNFEVAFDADVAIVIDRDFCRGHSVSGPQVAAQCK